MSESMEHEGLAPELVDVFLEELEEGIHHLNVTLLALEDAEGYAACVGIWSACLRTAHSLKGAAQATRASAVADALHLLEDLCAAQKERGHPPGSSNVRSLLSVVDAIAATAERLGSDGEAALAALARFVDSRRADAAGIEPPSARSPAPALEAAGGVAGGDLGGWDDRLEALGQLVSEWLRSHRAARELAPGPARAAGFASASTHLHGVATPFEQVLTAVRASRGALAEIEAPTDAVDASERACGRRLLVVDDSATMRVAQRRLFEGAGYQVESACDGLEAWEMLELRSFDAVVSDVIMPKLDGIGLTEKIRRSPAFVDLPVVLVSSMDGAECEGRARDAGAAAYIVKSGSGKSHMVATVADVLEGAR